jgi:hypothetical protein
MRSSMRPLLALTLLSIATTAGCQWKAILDDVLDGKDGAGKGTGTGAGGGRGTDPGASLTCEAAPNADGTVCKRCVDASGVVVREDCPPSSATGSGGSVEPTGGSTGTAGSAGGSCIKIDGGGVPSSCKDAATWKKYGADACAQQNMELSDIAYGPACGANFQNATYVCCGGTTSGGTGAGGASGGTATTCDAYTNAAGAVCKRCVDASGVVLSDECPPPQPPTSCTKINDGGPSSCKDAATWKQYGATSCARLGLTLSDIAYGTPCGASFQDVVYVCCGTIAPSCSLDIDALGNTCKTCWDAAGVVVESVCKSSGVRCEESAGADGAKCTTCTYPDGRIYSAECQGGSTGATEICDVKTSADGAVCKVCYEPDGTTISSCP